VANVDGVRIVVGRGFPGPGVVRHHGSGSAGEEAPSNE
jgi:hypothetical protein